MDVKFIVDINAGKLTKWLRIMGYDTLLFTGHDDGEMVKIASQQNRVILTKDSQLMKRRVITSGNIKAILVDGEDSRQQLRQVVKTLELDYNHRPFSICLECNQPLSPIAKDEVKNIVPPHVFKTHDLYMQCPVCHRIYWQGTHWEAMSRELGKFDKR